MRLRSGSRPRIDGYANLDEIGRGGFSRVYIADQVDFGRRVALKVITRAIDDAGQEAFRREQRITGRLDGHPNIVRVHDAGVTRSGQPYLAMEYLADGTVADRLRRHGPLPVDEALRIGVLLACALDAAHRIGVVHRDVKPQNVLWSPYVGPVLADFGIAGILGDHRSDPDAFSVLHAAPEVLAGGPSTPVADLHSAASTVYELLTGRAPFHDPRSPGMPAFLARADAGDVAPIDRPDLPADAAAALGRLLRRDPDERPPTGLDLAGRLRAVESMLGFEPTAIVGDRPTHAVVRVPASVSAGPVSDATPELVTVPPPIGPETLAPPPAAGPDPAPVSPNPDGPSIPSIPTRRRRNPNLAAAAVVAIIAVAVGIRFGTGGGSTRDTDTATLLVRDQVGTDPVAAICPPANTARLTAVQTPVDARPVATSVAAALDGDDLVVSFRGDGLADTTYVVFLRCRPEEETTTPTLVPLTAIAGDEPAVYRIDAVDPTVAWCVAVGVVEPPGGTRLGNEGNQITCA